MEAPTTKKKDSLTGCLGEANLQLNSTNFMRQFRDPDSRELKQLTAQQFMEVWEHYDDDGENMMMTRMAQFLDISTSEKNCRFFF